MKKLLLSFVATIIVMSINAESNEPSDQILAKNLPHELPYSFTADLYNGNWFQQDNNNFDASAYDYVWVEYENATANINIGITYREWLSTESWGERFDSADKRLNEGSGIAAVKIEKKKTITQGVNGAKVDFAGDTYDKHVMNVFLQAWDNGQSATIKGIYFGTKEKYKEALKAAGIGTLQINELMQSNIDCVMDDLNDFPDSWVELYNPTNATINLQDYKIGTKEKVSKAWQLPTQKVLPGDYVVIYCDKAGEDEGVSAIHTDFRLESGNNGNLYLFKDDEIVDKLESMAKQPAPNIAYGRKTEDSDDWGYQATPTPNAANCKQLCKEILDEPIFSQKGMVMEHGQSFELTLSLPDDAPPGTIIRYTLDGSEPTNVSEAYTNPLTITNTKTIRAKLFCDGYLSPRSTCHSYIFFPRELTLPVISIMTDDKYLNDSKIGIYVEGDYQSDKKNYEFDWRRPINFEYFEGTGTDSKLNQLCETRIAGGATRENDRKTFAIYANKRFGTKRLEYEFFPDQKPGLTDFKSLMLRNAGNDFHYLYMRDAIIQRTMASHVDLDWQAWSPAIIYINGQYTGILNIRERSNEDNIYTNYDGLEDIDMFENWWELKEGSWDNYNKFRKFYNEKGHTLAEYAEWMDWEEFLNLMIMNLYFNNQDFPGNNIVMWRPQAEGGKWRWVAKDTDFGLGLYNDWTGNNKYGPAFNSIKWINEPNYDPERNWANQSDHTRLFRRLMDDKDFYREFIDRTCIYMGDFLNEKGIREVWDPMYDIIKYEYPYHREGINKWWPNYNEELENTRNWVAKRTKEFYEQIGYYYHLGFPVSLVINKEKDDIEITFNGIKLSKGTFDGKFFANRTLTISGKASEDIDFRGWKVTGGIDKKVYENKITLEMPSKAITITPIIGEETGIDKIQTNNDKSIETFDLTGRKINMPQKGQIYIQKGQKTIWH